MLPEGYMWRDADAAVYIGDILVWSPVETYNWHRCEGSRLGEPEWGALGLYLTKMNTQDDWTLWTYAERTFAIEEINFYPYCGEKLAIGKYEEAK